MRENRPLEKRILGKTRLQVSLLGLGGGGHSRLGLSAGQSIGRAADVVRAALDMGITLLDTARVYGTEPALGLALPGHRRDQVVVASKCPYLDENDHLLSPAAFQRQIDDSLHDLGLEYIDLYFIHAVLPAAYAQCRERFLPVLQQARQSGKIRHFGLTEYFEGDKDHRMLQLALQDSDWDAYMVGFNLLNQTARSRVFAHTRQQGIGTLGMFAVRRALIDPARLRSLLSTLATNGEIDPALASAPDLMEALGLTGVADSLSEAAYRYCAFEPGLDCVLSGTGSPDHLQQNLAAVQRGPLPPAVNERLAQLFGRVNSVTGQIGSN